MAGSNDILLLGLVTGLLAAASVYYFTRPIDTSATTRSTDSKTKRTARGAISDAVKGKTEEYVVVEKRTLDVPQDVADTIDPFDPAAASLQTPRKSSKKDVHTPVLARGEKTASSAPSTPSSRRTVEVKPDPTPRALPKAYEEDGHSTYVMRPEEAAEYVNLAVKDNVTVETIPAVEDHSAKLNDVLDDLTAGDSSKVEITQKTRYTETDIFDDGEQQTVTEVTKVRVHDEMLSSNNDSEIEDTESLKREDEEPSHSSQEEQPEQKIDINESSEPEKHDEIKYEESPGSERKDKHIEKDAKADAQLEESNIEPLKESPEVNLPESAAPEELEDSDYVNIDKDEVADAELEETNIEPLEESVNEIGSDTLNLSQEVPKDDQETQNISETVETESVTKEDKPENEIIEENHNQVGEGKSSVEQADAALKFKEEDQIAESVPEIAESLDKTDITTETTAFQEDDLEAILAKAHPSEGLGHKTVTDHNEPITENTILTEDSTQSTKAEPELESISSDSKPVENPTEEIAEEPAEEVTEVPVEEVTESPVEEVNEEPAEEVNEESVGEVAKEPSEEVAEEPSEETTGEPIETSVENPAEEVAKETTKLTQSDEEVMGSSTPHEEADTPSPENVEHPADAQNLESESKEPLDNTESPETILAKPEIGENESLVSPESTAEAKNSTPSVAHITSEVDSDAEVQPEIADLVDEEKEHPSITENSETVTEDKLGPESGAVEVAEPTKEELHEEIVEANIPSDSHIQTIKAEDLVVEAPAIPAEAPDTASMDEFPSLSAPVEKHADVEEKTAETSKESSSSQDQDQADSVAGTTLDVTPISVDAHASTEDEELSTSIKEDEHPESPSTPTIPTEITDKTDIPAAASSDSPAKKKKKKSKKKSAKAAADVPDA